ncbi:MAG: FIST signal transduction protein [Geminicoccaceae bacterium]
MKTEKLIAKADGHWQSQAEAPIEANLVCYFGTREAIEDGALFAALRDRYPSSAIMGCSTGGQILEDDVTDDVATAIAAKFDSSTVRLTVQQVADSSESRSCGQAIAEALRGDGLAGIFILSDGLCVNGSQLIAGVVEKLGSDIPVAGGLAGDGSTFARTLVSGNTPPKENTVVAAGFYGSKLHMRTGTAGGWDEFGPKRTITRAAGNVLYELDGRPALDLYMRYLGDEAAGLPGTALLFPLRVSDPDRPDHDIVRTVLSVDKEAKSMIFAGDVPEGWTAQLMRGRFDKLAEGAGDAARQASPAEADPDGFGLMVSCIGRRLLMGQLIANEVEEVFGEIGRRNELIGFYSYGEIAPHAVSHIPMLHNQTMTVATIVETA